MLEFSVEIPEFALRIQNADEVVKALGRSQSAKVRNRIRQGKGAFGPLPMSKDGRPLRRTDQLLNSVDYEYYPAGTISLPYAVVMPTGVRDEQELARVGRARRRRAGRRRRAAYRDLLARQAAGDSTLEGLTTKKLKRRASSIGRLKYRMARRNMDVAAILANPPKDPRAKAGRRGVYIVFKANARDKREAAKLAARLARFALQEKGTPYRHEGRGVYDR